MNMKNKSKMTVVMSSAGSPSKIGALEMLVSFALQTWSEKARNRVRGEAGTVFAKKPRGWEQPDVLQYCAMFCISKNTKRQEPLLKKGKATGSNGYGKLEVETPYQPPPTFSTK